MDQFSDDEFSSGSSSVDPSQLLLDWNPTFDGASALNESKQEQPNSPDSQQSEQSNEIKDGVLEEHKKDDGADKSDVSERLSRSHELTTRKEEVRIVLGQSILDWQKERKGADMKEKSTEWVTIRHEHNGPLPTGSKLTIDSSTANLVYETDGDLQEQTGQRSSSESSHGAWVDCVAVYDEDRQCYVLSKVDWTASLKRVRKPTVDPAVKPSKKSTQKQARKAVPGKHRKRRSFEGPTRPTDNEGKRHKSAK